MYKKQKEGKHQFCRIQKMSNANLSIKFVEKKFVEKKIVKKKLSNSTFFTKICRIRQFFFDKFY